MQVAYFVVHFMFTAVFLNPRRNRQSLVSFPRNKSLREMENLVML